MLTIARNAARGLRNRIRDARTVRQVEAIRARGDGTSTPFPNLVTLEPTRRCNLHCVMCYTSEVERYTRMDELSVEEIDRVFSELPVKRVNLVGGEVFIRKDIFQIMDNLVRRGIVIENVTTNGTLLDEEKAARLAEYIKRKQLSGLTFSIDGEEEMHNAIRKSPKAFELTMRGIAQVLEALKARGVEPRKHVKITSVVTPDNVAVFSKVVGVAARAGVPTVQYNHLICATEAEIQATEMMLGLPRAEVDTWIVPDLEGKIRSEDVLKEMAVAEAEGAKHGIRVHFRPAKDPAGVKAHYANQGPFGGTCWSPFDNCRITFSGKVNYCLLLRSEMGDVRTQSVAEIWNGEKFRRLRKELLAAPYPICRRCCKLSPG